MRYISARTYAQDFTICYLISAARSIYRGKCPHIPGLRRAKGKQRPLTSLQSITQPNHFFLQIACLLLVVFFFFFQQQHEYGCLVDRFPTDCRAAAQAERRCDVFLKHFTCFRLHVKSACSTLCEARDGNGFRASGRNGGKPHKTLHSREQSLFSTAALISTDTEAQAIIRFNLDLICLLADHSHVLREAAAHLSQT